MIRQEDMVLRPAALYPYIVDKVQSRKLGVTAVAGVAAGTGAVDITWPIAAIAMAYILGQAYVDGRG